MKGIVEFTTAQGRRIGLPQMGGLIIADVDGIDVPEKPEGAKCIVRYVSGQTPRAAWLRDPYKQVLSCMPLSAMGPWAHMTDNQGASIVFPRGSVIAYEEVLDDVFTLTLSLMGPPAEVVVRATFDDLVKTAGLVEDSDEPELPKPPSAKAAGPAKAKPKKRARG